MHAANEAAKIFDDVMAGIFKWLDPNGLDANSSTHLTPKALQTLITALKDESLGEKLIQRTWDKTYQPYFDKLVAIAGQRHWASDSALLDVVLRSWSANTRSRQIAHDKLRQLWKQAKWEWPDQIRSMRARVPQPSLSKASNDFRMPRLMNYVCASKAATGSLKLI